MNTQAAQHLWSPSGLERVLPDGQWLVRDEALNNGAITGVVIDSRLATPGVVFAALKGDHEDGHDYVRDAVRNGARSVLVERDVSTESLTDANVMKVPSVVDALAALAREYRKSLDHPTVIGITGSSGKTSTKDLLAAVLTNAGKTSASVSSFNNHLGVPLTILNAEPDDRYVICEIGTNAPGEIAHLARLVHPEIALITNIGTCHVEGLGSLAGIASEKASLLSHLRPGGRAFTCADQPLLMSAVSKVSCALETFGISATAVHRVVETRVSRRGTEFTLNDHSQWFLRLIGAHHAVNATAVIAMARHLGLSDSLITAGLSSVTPATGRFMPVHFGTSLLFDDSYNANPESMAAALRTFFLLSTDGPRRTIILGDMLELGNESHRQHASVGRLIAELAAAHPGHLEIILFGKAMGAAIEVLATACPDLPVIHEADADDEAIGRAIEMARRADRVLVKGSRLNRLERITNAVVSQD